VNDRPRRYRLAAIIGTALCALLATAAAPLPDRWSHWRYSRPIELPATNETRIVSVTIPPGVYPHSQSDLSDLRVIDNAGGEVPYARFTRLGSNNSVTIPTQVLENSFAPGHYTQAVLRTEKQVPFHDAVRIDTTETDFIEWAEVAASDDARTWRIVQPRAPIFRFQKEGRSGTQTVSYSENNARYLRIRILDGKTKFPITGAGILYQTSEPPERAPVGIHLTADPHPPAHSTSWIADVGRDSAPVAEVRFDVAGKTEFIRAVAFSTSTEQRNWSAWATGEIYRYRQDGASGTHMQEHLAVALPYGAGNARYWRVEIMNGDDPPLQDVKPVFFTTPRHLVFEEEPGHTYTLIYGQYRASAPQYDLERRLDSTQEMAAVVGTVGAEEEDSNYSDPRPWTEQHTMVLWIVVGFVAVLLGFSAIRSLKRAER
jgi:Protein of unknown function (DUF3999)